MNNSFDDPAIWLDENAFAEWITYIPRKGGQGGFPRRILAVIERDHWKPYGPQGGGHAAGRDIAPVIDVWISTDPIQGANVIDTGGDKLKFARRPGDPESEQMIAEKMGDSTPQMWHLRIR